MSEILQIVTLGRVVNEPGVIRLTYDYRIPSNLTEFSITFGNSWTEIRSEGFEISEGTCKWRPRYGEDPSIDLKFRVDTDIGASSYVDTGEWAITRLPNLSWSWRYRGGSPKLVQRYDVQGEGVTSGDGAVAYLGPYSEYTEHSPETNEEFRLVVPRDANLRDDPKSILEALRHASEYLDIGALNDSVLAIAAPTSAQNWAAKGTQRGDDGFWVRDDAVTDETNETWVHEYVHTRQRFARYSETYWFQEGAADYFAALAALERGDIEFSEFHHFLTSTRDRSAVLSDTSTWRSKSTAYRRGRRACAALDELIRERSDGDSTLMDGFVKLNHKFKHSEDTSTAEVSHIRDAVDTVTDRRVSGWFQEYVHRAQVPEISTDPAVFIGEASEPDTGVRPEPEPEPESGHRCPICNKTTTDNFCPICGYEFESISSNEQPRPGDGTTGTRSDGTCPICGTVSDERFCPTCGYDMDDSDESEGSSTEISDVKMCEICDTKTEDRRCPTCGAELY